MITLIAAIGLNNEIGFDNHLLWNIPEDMRHFKDYTTGKVVIMGRRTFESIGRILPGRKNVIITSRNMQNILHVASVEDAFTLEHCYPELVVIGGESVYRHAMQYASKLVITHINAKFKADVFFPKIDLTKWQISSKVYSSNETFEYSFTEYEKLNNGCVH